MIGQDGGILDMLTFAPGMRILANHERRTRQPLVDIDWSPVAHEGRVPIMHLLLEFFLGSPSVGLLEST